ncbi:hypothetical protein HDV57DRAFT_482536, partial [Trichoderma longibrachiatum]
GGGGRPGPGGKVGAFALKRGHKEKRRQGGVRPSSVAPGLSLREELARAGYFLAPVRPRLRKPQTRFFLLLLLLVAQVTKSLVSLGGVHEERRFVVARNPAKETSEKLPVGLLGPLNPSQSPELEALRGPRSPQEAPKELLESFHGSPNGGSLTRDPLCVHARTSNVICHWLVRGREHVKAASHVECMSNLVQSPQLQTLSFFGVAVPGEAL